MRLSLVMATIDREAQVARLIGSLAAQSDRDFELVVVDQNRDDRLVPILSEGRALGLDIVHERRERAGLSAARNRGIEVARGDVIGFPDDDCWYDHDVVQHVRGRLRAQTGLHGVVGFWAERGGRPPASRLLSSVAWRRFRGGDASSITLFLRSDLLRQLGGFDERLGVGSWFGAAEETDVLLRALEGGARLQFCPEVIVHHRYSAVPDGDWHALCRNARRRARGTGALYAKHRLDAGVILRGMIAPLVMPALRTRRSRAVLQGVFTTVGRAEGYLRWKREES